MADEAGYLTGNPIPFIVIAVSILSSVLCELISWGLIYRTPRFKEYREQSDSLNEQIEAEKDVMTTIEKRKKVEKRVKALEDRLALLKREMSLARIKALVIVGVILFGAFHFISSVYEGVVSARLPFFPVSFIQMVTHRGLEGEDYLDCSVTFLYVLSSMCVRPAVERFFSFLPPRDAMDNPWGGLAGSPPS